MAELILTDEEKASPSYLDWDDADLGKVVKKLALTAGDDYGAMSAKIISMASVLVSFVADSNATDASFELTGVRSGNIERGDWIVTLAQTKDHPDAS